MREQIYTSTLRISKYSYTGKVAFTVIGQGTVFNFKSG